MPDPGKSQPKSRSGMSPKRASAPDHAQAIGSNPLLLLIHQPLITSKGEQRVEALLEPLQFVGLNIDNRSKFAMAISLCW